MKELSNCDGRSVRASEYLDHPARQMRRIRSGRIVSFSGHTLFVRPEQDIWVEIQDNN